VNQDAKPDAQKAVRAGSLHKSGASKEATCSSCGSNCFGQCSQAGAPIQLGTDLEPLYDAWFDKSGEDLKKIEVVVDFVAWISRANFFYSQQLEPTVGDQSSGCPSTVEALGVKGLSVYTALFDNVDMETFTCNSCSHKVDGDLEDAITHQRIHFRHYPYQCLGTQTLWYVSCSPLF
jgi:hypothetical protein